MKFLNFLSHPKMLWATFLLTLILFVISKNVMDSGHFINIASMPTVGRAHEYIATLSPNQRSMHARLTGTIGVVLPFAYGAFFIGIAIRYFGRYGVWFAIPSFLLIPAALVLNFAFIMLLTGQNSFIDLKLISTINDFLYNLGFFVTVLGLLIAITKAPKPWSFLFWTALMGLLVVTLIFIVYGVGLHYNPSPTQKDTLVLWRAPFSLLPSILLVLGNYLPNVIGKLLLSLACILGLFSIGLGARMIIGDPGDGLLYAILIIYGILIIMTGFQVRKHWSVV